MQAVPQEVELRVGLAGTEQAQVQRYRAWKSTVGTSDNQEVPGRLRISPGLALSRDLQVHVILVKNTLVGDTFYLKCGRCRSPR